MPAIGALGYNLISLNTLDLAMKTSAFLALAALSLPFGAQAEQLWSDNSLSALYGDGYKRIPVGQSSQAKTLTLEHASGHSWGGVFFFLDRIHSQRDHKESYAELSPSFYLLKLAQGPIKSLNAELTYEFGSNSSGFSQDNYLAGLGLSWNVAGMDFFKTTLYHAWNNNSFGQDEDDQLSLSYGWHQGNLYVDGFLDYTPSQSRNKESELNFTPQITYDLGPVLGLKNKVKLGVEYAYWHNKFANTEDQNNLSLLLKWHL